MNKQEPDPQSDPPKSKRPFEFLVLSLLTFLFVIGFLLVIFFVQTSHTIFIPTDEFVGNSKRVDVFGYPKTINDEAFDLTRFVSNVEVLEIRDVPNGKLAVIKLRLYDKIRLLFTKQELFLFDPKLGEIADVISIK